MQTINCSKHSKPNCILDLTLSLLICQRCALFQPQFKNHQFLQASQLKDHASKLYYQFQKELQALNLSRSGSGQLKCMTLQTLLGSKLKEHIEDINKVYQEMISQLQKQRVEKIQKINKDINHIKVQLNSSLNALVKERYDNVKNIHDSLIQKFNQLDFLSVLEVFNKNGIVKTVQDMQKDLKILQIDFKQKIDNIHFMSPQSQLLTKRKSSQKEELLILPQTQTSLFDISRSATSSCLLSCNSSVCGTERTFKTKLGSETTKKDENERNEQQSFDQSNKKIKILSNKSEIKNIFIKNNIRHVVMTKLGMNNREVIQAIRKCTLNSFVSKIDVSSNDITNQLFVMLKRQKIQSKYLKTIVAKGLQIDRRLLTKQGIRIQQMQNHRVVIGDLTFQL